MVFSIQGCDDRCFKRFFTGERAAGIACIRKNVIVEIASASGSSRSPDAVCIRLGLRLLGKNVKKGPSATTVFCEIIHKTDCKAPSKGFLVTNNTFFP
jgi:hypothetical protein